MNHMFIAKYAKITFSKLPTAILKSCVVFQIMRVKSHLQHHFLKHGQLLWLHGGCAGHEVDTIVNNSKHLLSAVVLYCGILINIDDIVVCRRTLKTKEFKSLGERDVKCREKCAYEEKMVPACS